MKKIDFTGKYPVKDAKWRANHLNIIKDVLSYIFSKDSGYVLKGGTSLMLYYGLPRFSEDIDLDGISDNILEILQKYAEDHQRYSCNINKNTATVKRCMLHYGSNSIDVLKIETSYRSTISKSTYTNIDGVNVYKPSVITNFKAHAYEHRDRIRDLFDVSYLINNYFEQLSDETKASLADSLVQKGIEQFDYLVRTQKDDLIDVDQMETMFLEAWQKLGLPI